MKSADKLYFSDCLQQSLLVLASAPWLWTGYVLVIAVLLAIGRFSPIIGIFSTVCSVFVGVGLAKYCDLKASENQAVSLFRAVKISLPLAIIAATGIVVCWFVFMTIANVLSGEAHKILLFFLNWELTHRLFSFNSVHELAAWLFTYANVTLVFALLMLSSFVGWFTHPLMLFNSIKFTEAKARSVYAVSRHQVALYKIFGFIFLEAVLCSTVTPLLTPVLMVLVSCFLYVSYKKIFAAE